MQIKIIQLAIKIMDNKVLIMGEWLGISMEDKWIQKEQTLVTW